MFFALFFNLDVAPVEQVSREAMRRVASAPAVGVQIVDAAFDVHQP
jgi:hypothetical protein